MRTTPSDRILPLRSVLAFTSAALFLGSTAASAQTCAVGEPASAKEAVSALTTLARDRCLAERPKTCQTEVCEAFEEEWLSEASFKRSDVQPALEALMDNAAGVTELPEESRRVAGRMALYLAELIDADGDPFGPASAMFRADQTLRSFEGQSDFVIDWSETFRRGCAIAERCSGAFDAAVGLLESIVLFRRVIASAQAEDAMALAAYVRVLDARWQHYLLSGRAQYPWELSVNSLFRRTGRGLVMPPTHQFILLHPSAGYEMSRTAESRLTESLVLELAGLYRFRWAEKNRGAAQLSGFGASVLMAARSSPAGKASVGYGAMAYLPRGWAIGYVWRSHASGDEHTVLVNADLAKLFIKGESLQRRVRRLTSR
jgi:hypothetical protein